MRSSRSRTKQSQACRTGSSTTIKCPTLIVRGGEKDYDHPKRTSFEVHALIKGSRLIEPPWPEDAWERASVAHAAGTGALFGPWVEAAPVLLDFIGEP